MAASPLTAPPITASPSPRSTGWLSPVSSAWLTDGVVVEGRTTVNQALLTGESQPVERGEGDAVIGGAVNGEAAIVLVVERTGSETYLAQVIEVVRQAQESRSRTQDLADRAAFWLTLIALSAGGLRSEEHTSELQSHLNLV